MEDLVKVCGTPAGYQRHRYHGQPPCTACTAAQSARNKRYRANWTPEQKVLARETQRTWRTLNREKANAYPRSVPPEKKRERTLKARYGVGAFVVEQLWHAQHQRCALGLMCMGGLIHVKEVQVDHDHEVRGPRHTTIRGLVCGRCNKLLGRFGDTLSAIRANKDRATSEKSPAVLILNVLEQYLLKTPVRTQTLLAEIMQGVSK